MLSTYGLKTEDRDLLSNIFKQAVLSEVRDDVLGEVFGTLRDRKIASELAIASLGVVEGRESKQRLVELLEKLTGSDSNSSDSDEEFVESDLSVLYQSSFAKVGLRWRLDSLNQVLGSLRKGDFGFLFARPETGKTTFLASEISFMASQLPEEAGPILWFNNEEQGSKVQTRIYQACLGYTLPELWSKIPENHQKYLDLTHGKIKIIDSASITKQRVEALCKKYSPSLVLFDQIDKIKGFNADREDLRLGAIYIWAREIAKTYCPVIGVCQADGTAEGVKYLQMDHVANAKTAKQAEADWILGIGCIHDKAFEFVRFFSVCKNKLQGDEDTNPSWRHRRWDVLITPDIARYQDYK